MKQMRVAVDLRETEILKVMRVPRGDHVVATLGISHHPDGYWLLVQEELAHGPLDTWLQRRAGQLSAAALLPLVHQVASGMEVVAGEKIVHRNLAARNILVASEAPLICKVSDFGKARALGLSADYYKGRADALFPIKWQAPEVLRLSKFTHESDVWSYGVTAWEIMSFGAVPYGRMKGVAVLDSIERGERLQEPATCRECGWLYALMQSCWQADPGARPTFESIVRLLGERLGD